MEPKDLQNSEELKTTEQAELTNSAPSGEQDKVELQEDTNDQAKVENPSGAEKSDTIEKSEENKESEEVVTEDKKTENLESAPPQKEKKEIDYNTYSRVELVNALRDLLDNNQGEDIKSEVETIKAVFYKKVNERIKEARKQFLEQGGTEEEFTPEADPYENDIKELLKKYREIRVAYNQKLEQEKEENLKKKYEVIEKIKALINSEESLNKTFNEFRKLQQEWREIGLVPQSKLKDLWESYHFHVEQFYDYVKINRELRDLDLKKNLELKTKLCEKAEELLLDSSIIRAFNTLQKYHEQWREIGPVPHEQKEAIWERFKLATSKINKKHQEYFENRKQEQKKNLEAKTALCEKAEAILEKEIKTHKEWDDHSKELIELQKVWRTIGFAPKKDNNRIYERFRSACDQFFDRKREFYAKNKEEQLNNLQLKTDLCVQAEALKDSTDWKKTTQEFIEIQKKWKEIGPVPRKYSDAIWKRFRTACDYFFDKKDAHFSGQSSEFEENLKQKEALIEEIKAFKSFDDIDETLQHLKDFQRRWSEIGHVPYSKKESIQEAYRTAINEIYDQLNLNEEKRNLLKFRNKIASYAETPRGKSKISLEREKFMNKLKQLENDLVLLDNNIGFFAASKNAQNLIKDVQKKIEATKKKIELLKQKIRIIDELYQD